MKELESDTCRDDKTPEQDFFSDSEESGTVFTSYLVSAIGCRNYLLDYLGNRANVIFESTASLYFHIPYIIDFLHMLDHKNNLLQAVEEDANEKISIAELRALGLFYITAIKPLWNKVNGATNNLSTINDTYMEGGWVYIVNSCNCK